MIESFINGIREELNKLDFDMCPDDVEFRKGKNFTAVYFFNTLVARLFDGNKGPVVEIKASLFDDHLDSPKAFLKFPLSLIFFDYLLQQIKNVFMLCYSKAPYDTFGCCSSFIECSDAKQCVNPNIKLSRGCYYKKNLEKGMIFYGKNANDDRRCL